MSCPAPASSILFCIGVNGTVMTTKNLKTTSHRNLYYAEENFVVNANIPGNEECCKVARFHNNTIRLL